MSVVSDNELFSFEDSSKTSRTSARFTKKTLYKYTILAIICFIQFTKVYCENVTVGLQHTIMQVMKIDNTMYGVLNSAETYPGMILPLIGGLCTSDGHTAKFLCFYSDSWKSRALV